MSESSFDVFLCHVSEDKAIVRELGEQLRGLGLRVWLDEWELRPGIPWQELLENAIETVGAAAILYGPSGVGPWATREMRAFLSEFVDRNVPVIPVLLPGASTQPQLPPFLKAFTWVDLRGGLTPNGLSRLTWGITGNRGPEATRSALPDATTPWVDPETGVRWLWVPGGEFVMGARELSDAPEHLVRVSAFWLGETPVTNAQYERFVRATHHAPSWASKDQRYSRPEQPVVGVSWADAVAYCEWASQVARHEVKLPSETQWEFAARGPQGRKYPWGEQEPDATRAFFGDRKPLVAWQAAPVGSCPAGRGPFGHLDLAGNVAEWCRDVWNDRAYAARAALQKVTVDPEVVAGEGESRCLRGFGSPPERLRPAYRNGYLADVRLTNIGFRVSAVPASRRRPVDDT